MMFGEIPEGKSQAAGKPARDAPALVTECGRVRLEMRRDHPMLVQHIRIVLQAWRANADSALIVDQCIDKIVRYITG